MRELDERRDKLRAEAHANTQAALGRTRQQDPFNPDREYFDRFEADPAYRRAEKLDNEVRRIGI